MTGRRIRASFAEDAPGRDMHTFIADLYPLCRSITGNGLRETLRRIQTHIPLTIHEVPSGTHVFDWTVPREWNIRDGWVKNAQGEKVIDFSASNLHVVNYSVPVHKKVSLPELREHLFTIPEFPDWIPYRTAYYHESWGFCLSHNRLRSLKDEEYEVYIDATLEQGRLSYGEYYLQGMSDEEILISCHTCHPSLCNDNLSGVALATFLAKHLRTLSGPRYSYRFLFMPGTIGAITWLCLNEPQIERIRHGLVVACVGDSGPFTYKKSRRGNAEIDRAATHVLAHSGREYKIVDFSPYGYDERQFCSPGFNLPVGSLTRTPYGRFPEYHTSADNLDLVRPEALSDSFAVYLSLLEVLQENNTYVNTRPKCEPNLGSRGLYGDTTGEKERLSLLWVLNQSDGTPSLLDIAEKADLDFSLISAAADALSSKGLLRERKPERTEIALASAGSTDGNTNPAPCKNCEVLE
jgi:aminopeptidase-like protein